MVDIISGIIIAVVFACASFYIYSQKKKGRKCIGCPMCDSCAKNKK